MKKMPIIILTVVLLTGTSIFANEDSQQLSMLTGVFHHYVKGLSPYYIELDGSTARFDLRGSELEKIEDGTRILVRGEIKSWLFDITSAPNPVVQPLQWIIYMDVEEIEVINTPFGNLISPKAKELFKQ